jgi:insulysin
MPPIERITDQLEKPALDDRDYRVIRLPNKLEALLVHDPDTDKASAAVNVNVGNFSDVDFFEGTAHAVEHLLFMGTKKVWNSSCLAFRVIFKDIYKDWLADCDFLP